MLQVPQIGVKTRDSTSPGEHCRGLPDGSGGAKHVLRREDTGECPNSQPRFPDSWSLCAKIWRLKLTLGPPSNNFSLHSVKADPNCGDLGLVQFPLYSSEEIFRRQAPLAHRNPTSVTTPGAELFPVSCDRKTPNILSYGGEF